jgi:hypothetical protein
VTSLAYPLPIGVISDPVGVPEDSRAAFRAWTQPIVSPEDHSVDAFVAATMEMHAFIRS